MSILIQPTVQQVTVNQTTNAVTVKQTPNNVTLAVVVGPQGPNFVPPVTLVSPPSGATPLILKGSPTVQNPPLLVFEGTHGFPDIAFVDPSNNQAKTVIVNGTIFSAVGFVSSGRFSASVDANNNFSIADFGLDKTNGIPAMIVTVSDVGGPNIVHELSTASGSFFQLGIDTNGNWIHSVEANGSILWGAGSTHASMDVGLKRMGAGILGVRNGQPDNALSLLQAADFAAAYAAKTAAYTLTANDGIIAANAATAAFAVTLPAANSVPAGRPYTVKKTDSSANAVTLTAAGTDKIDGVATYALSTQNKYVRVISDGSANWNVVANN